jgi:hypothetical protein
MGVLDRRCVRRFTTFSVGRVPLLYNPPAVRGSGTGTGTGTGTSNGTSVGWRPVVIAWHRSRSRSAKGLPSCGAVLFSALLRVGHDITYIARHVNQRTLNPRLLSKTGNLLGEQRAISARTGSLTRSATRGGVLRPGGGSGDGGG